MNRQTLERESNDYRDFRNQACFTFSLDDNSDILMLIEPFKSNINAVFVG